MNLTSTEQRLSPGRKWAVMVLLTIFFLGITIVAAEIAVRVRQHLNYGTSATVEDYYTVDPKINLRVPIANVSNGRIAINALGFRGPEIPVEKPPRTLRLAFLGASTTWSGEVSGNDHVWPHLVTGSLSRTFPNVRFDYVNAGVPGYTMGSILKSLEHRVAPLKPDVVVIYEASNNVTRELREAAAAQGLTESSQWQPFSWVSEYSLLWLLAEKNLRVLSAQHSARMNRTPLTLHPATLGQAYREELTKVVRAAQQDAKVVALATFSIHPRREQDAEHQMRASSSAFVYIPFATPQLIIETFERYNGIVREVARETGALLIEGEHEIPGDFAHFTDTVHLTDAGSKRMAERIGGALAVSPEIRKLAATTAQ